MKQLPLLSDIPTSATQSKLYPLHSISKQETAEIEWLISILSSNKKFDVAYSTNWSKEIKQFVSFLGTMLLAFPSGLIMRNIVRRNKRLAFILQFPELLSVRNNIEKGSFAYDTLLFRQSAFQVLQNKSHLANLVCLAILFGDEFIDGIAVTTGKSTIRNILQDQAVDCHLHFKQEGKQTILYYAFDIRQLLAPKTLATKNEKYGITYNDFYDHLLFLLAEMNRHLNMQPANIRDQTAKLICDICNRCFDTYKTDIAAFKEDYHLDELLEYLDRKDDEIVHSLLELRAVLLHKNTPTYTSLFKGWSTMVRSMQIYDDMEDVATDNDYQMNFVCFFAHRFFYKEWEWLQANATAIQSCSNMQRHLLVSVFMPASVIACKQYARHIVLSELNWVQKKITGYLWKKNWLGWGNKQYVSAENIFSNSFFSSAANLHEKIAILQQNILGAKDSFITEDLAYAHMLDTILLDEPLRKSFFSFMPKKEAYWLTHHFFDYPVSSKSIWIQKWLAYVSMKTNSNI